VAASSGKNSDLVQIVLLTFALCAVFFTGWGIYSNYRGNKLIRERAVQLQRLKDLTRELRKSESRQILKNERRRKESEENSGQIDTAVASVLAKSNLRKATDNTDPPKPQGVGSQRVYEHTYRITFDPSPIDEVYRFLARLEAEQPHLEFKRVKVSSKKKREEDPDEWQLDLTLVTYTSE